MLDLHAAIGHGRRPRGPLVRSDWSNGGHVPVHVLVQVGLAGLGAGALAVVGGTVAIVGFLTITTGAIIAVQGYDQLSYVGVEALTGFVSAFFNVG